MAKKRQRSEAMEHLILFIALRKQRQLAYNLIPLTEIKFHYKQMNYILKVLYLFNMTQVMSVGGSNTTSVIIEYPVHHRGGNIFETRIIFSECRIKCFELRCAKKNIQGLYVLQKPCTCRFPLSKCRRIKSKVLSNCVCILAQLHCPKYHPV